MNELVIIQKQNVVTDSLTVADKFGKRHDDVLKKIVNIIRDDEKGLLNFAESSYINSQNKEQKKYIMDRKSFSVLCMSFTGKKALSWKIRFYDAFEAMEKALLQQVTQKNSVAWLAQRAAGKITRREETDTIKQFVDYATEQGSKSANRYYCNITKMQNKALFILEQKFPNLRTLLDLNQLATINVADSIVSKALAEGMTSNLNYKDIYKLAKKRVEVFAGLRGQTLIPATHAAKRLEA
jgi:Rha family phage regulatory protein